METALTTTTEKLRLDLMEICNCNKQELVMFICKDEQCPHRERQTLYCGICLEENHKQHATFLIRNEIDKQSKLWQDLKFNVTNTFQVVEALYKKYKPVIEYLEHSTMMPQVVLPT